VARRSGLGRGLGALIPTEVADDRSSAFAELPLASIVPNPRQPRVHFDEELLTALAASIRELGVLQPILVRPLTEGRYELVAGERRWRAAKRAGLPTIPALVKTVDNAASLEQALVENLHRQDLNAIEEAAAYQQLIEDFGLTHDELATRVGKSRVAITNMLRLFQLPPAIQRLVVERQLTAGHARALLGTPDRAFQESLARRAVADDLTVRAVEEAVRLRNEVGQGPSPRDAAAAAAGGRPLSSMRPAGLHALEERLSSHLDTRVTINLGTHKGKLTVEFADLDDLERIYRVMTDPAEPLL
jgi:ParB family transcriptional regulator, chromosome partitioning protein